MQTLEFLACITSLLGVYLVSEKKFILGWSINAFGDVLWILWGAWADAYFLIILQIAFLLIAFNGLRNA